MNLALELSKSLSAHITLLMTFAPRGPLMDKLLLTPLEAAAILSIGRTKVYELMERGCSSP